MSPMPKVKNRSLQVRLPDADHRRLKELAEQEGWLYQHGTESAPFPSRSEAARRLIVRGLNDLDGGSLTTDAEKRTVEISPGGWKHVEQWAQQVGVEPSEVVRRMLRWASTRMEGDDYRS